MSSENEPQYMCALLHAFSQFEPSHTHLRLTKIGLSKSLENTINPTKVDDSYYVGLL